MFSLGFHGHQEKIVAVADIGSGSVGLAIVALRAGMPAAVIAAERAVLPIEKRSRTALIAAIGEALSSVGARVHKQYVAKTRSATRPIEHVYAILRAPWSSSRTLSSVQHFASETIVTKQMITELARRAIAPLEAMPLTGHAEDAAIKHGDEFETVVIRVELNGYPTAKPAGKRASSLAVTLLASSGDPKVIVEMRARLERIFPHLVPVFRSSTRSLISVLHEAIDGRDCLIVDMDDEGTALVTVHEGIPAECRGINEGARTILRRIAGNGLPEHTQSLVRMVERDECATDVCKDVHAGLARSEPELARIFGEAMSSCALPQRLPNTLILMADPDISSWLSKFFARIDFAQFTRTMQPFSVTLFNQNDLSRAVASAPGVVLDTGLALATSLVNTEAYNR